MYIFKLLHGAFQMIFYYFMYSLRTLQKYTSISLLYAIIMHFTFTYYYQLTLLFSLLSCVRLFGTSWTPGFPVFAVSWSLLKLTSIELLMPSNHLILCRPLLLLLSIFPSIRVFSTELALHIRWPKYWSFSISPSNEYSGLISFRIDCFDLLAVQGTLKFSPAPQFERIKS